MVALANEYLRLEDLPRKVILVSSDVRVPIAEKEYMAQPADYINVYKSLHTSCPIFLDTQLCELYKPTQRKVCGHCVYEKDLQWLDEWRKNANNTT